MRQSKAEASSTPTINLYMNDLTRDKVEAEPCECVYCSMCSGTGRERCGDYMGDSDPCEDCGGSGISEACERCRYLQEMDWDESELRDVLGDALK